MPVTHERSQGAGHPRMALGVASTAELLNFGSVGMCVTNNADVRIAAGASPLHRHD